jgi:hypothetical protein
MVEIEVGSGSRFGLWLDGNEPPANAVYNLTLQPRMDQLGISENLRGKHRLSDYKTKREMKKPELWKHLLSAQIEQELIDSGASLEEFDGFLLKPQLAIQSSPNALLVRGVNPTLDKRRITYAQIIVCGPSSQSEVAKGALHSVINKLYFNLSEPEDYGDYHGFEAECKQFLQYIMEISQDKEAYKDIGRRTGISIHRVLP